MKISFNWIVWLVALLATLSSCQDEDPSCVRIMLSPEALTLQVGQEAPLRLTGEFGGHTPQWIVGDTKVVSVNQQGIVQGLAEGDTWVQVRVGDATARSRVLVQKGNPKVVTFADANLKALILSAYPAVDADRDGEISIEEAQTVRSLVFAHESKDDIKLGQKITSLIGLEAFRALDTLDLKNQFVTDASPLFALQSLRQLNLGGNDIASIDLKKMVNLVDLRLYGNARMTSIDLSTNTKLEQIYLQRTGLTHLDLTMLKQLKQAYANQAQLIDIKFSGLPLLERIDMIKNKLTKIQASGLPKLKELHADNNSLTAVSISSMPELQRLNLYANKLEELKLESLPKLMFLFVFDNQLKSIDLSHLPMLFWLQIGSNPLKDLDMTKNPLIRTLEMEDMPNIELINLKNGGFNDDAEYEIAGNLSLRKVIVDVGAEYDFVKKIFSNKPSVSVVTE